MTTQLKSIFGAFALMLSLGLSYPVQAESGLAQGDQQTIKQNSAAQTQATVRLLLAWQRVGSPISLSV